MSEVSRYLTGVAKRATNLSKPLADAVRVLREDFEKQLESSTGPSGRTFAPLKPSTTRFGDRRSDRPYDTKERTTWDAYVSGGKVKIERVKLTIEVNTPGATFVGLGTKNIKARPIGPSDEAAEEVTNIVADYIVGE